MKTFFQDGDYRFYLWLLGEACEKFHVDLWAYCLMPNHVHVIAVPHELDSLSRAFGETHRQYSTFINTRHEWSGHLWQDRFASFPMKEAHCLMAARYVENNPVAAGLVTHAADWPWSSAASHCLARPNQLLKNDPLPAMVPQWSDFLAEGSVTDRHFLDDTGPKRGRPKKVTGYINTG